MPDLDPALTRAEAERRIQAALDAIQNAQQQLGIATAHLSSLEGCVSVWRLLGKLYDRVHSAWYRVSEFRPNGRKGTPRLDGVSREALAKRLGGGPLGMATSYCRTHGTDSSCDCDRSAP